MAATVRNKWAKPKPIRAGALSRQQQLAWTPFNPSAPPPTSTYDPAIDAQADAAKRGYGYTKQDGETNIARATSDYAVNSENLKRDFVNLGSRQNQAARARGIDLGGYTAGAKKVRDANQTRQQGALKLVFDRYTADQNTGINRAGLENEAFQNDAQKSRVAQATQMGWHPEQFDPYEAAGFRFDGNEYTDAKGPYKLARNVKNKRIYRIRPNGVIEAR